MKIEANTVEEYISKLPEDRKLPIEKLRSIFAENLPMGFQEVLSYGMIGFVVSKEVYPAGYHCSPELPLPYINLASQKNHIAVYHMGLYRQPDLMNWFKSEYPKHTTAKLDMGKSCVRFKRADEIPYELFKELAKKQTAKEWIFFYEQTIKR